MAVLKLPRLPTGAAIVDIKNGQPVTPLTRAWNDAMGQIETNVNDIAAAIAAADAAQSDADAAMAAAIAAQADADAAMAAAVAAQATADAAKATAAALDAALDVTAGKVLTVLNTMTLAAIDGSTLNIGTGGTLGTAAFTNASDYLPSGSSGSFLAKASNLSDVASVPTARTNLGVTATGADTTYAFRANNLSDLGSAATARTNLGLGTAAVANTGTSGANVPLLNGANAWSGSQEVSINAATGFTTYFHNQTAVPGACYINIMAFGGAAPNNTTAQFSRAGDNAADRYYLNSNGGISNYSANNVNLSDATVKGAIERYSETDLDALERSFLKVNWGRFKYLDQTHDDWNHGCTAQGVEQAFALTAPELVDEAELGPLGEDGKPQKHKVIYETDLTHIGLAVLSRLCKRFEAMESKMYAAGIT